MSAKTCVDSNLLGNFLKFIIQVWIINYDRETYSNHQFTMVKFMSSTMEFQK